VTLEQQLLDLDLYKKNLLTCYAMQIWYLDNWEMLQHCCVDRYMAQEYFINAIHGGQYEQK
jgi:hypothetical protein